jgi:hypothetical protein
VARKGSGNVEGPEVGEEEVTEETYDETADEDAAEEDAAEVDVIESANQDAQADAEGRDRADVNELQSFLPGGVTAPTNLPDDVLQGAGVGVDPADFVVGAPPAPEPELSSADKKRKERFAKLAQVDVKDVTAFNPTNYVGVTSAGGKYQMNRKGTQLRHLAGPVPAGLTSDKEKADQERLEKEANAEE